jgi:hypothetical protein
MQTDGDDRGKRHFREILDELGGELAIAYFVEGTGAGKIEGRQFINLLRTIESSLSSENSNPTVFGGKLSAAPAD